MKDSFSLFQEIDVLFLLKFSSSPSFLVNIDFNTILIVVVVVVIIIVVVIVIIAV